MLMTERFETAINEKGYKLLGQLSVSDEEYEWLTNYARDRVPCMTMPARADLLLTIFAVQVAIREFKEGRYWPCFSDVLGLELNAAKQSQIGQVVLETLKAFHLFTLKRDDRVSQMYVENIKAHAFVTNGYLNGYFDFAFAYFEKNLFRNISDDIDDDLLALSSYMANTLSNNEDAIYESESTRNAPRSYKLLKSTRSVFAQADPDLLRDIFLPTLITIEEYFYDDKLPEPKDRIANGFIEWQANRIRQLEGIEPKKTVYDEAKHIYGQRPYLMIGLRSGKGRLIIPKQKYRKDVNGVITVKVTENDQSCSKPLELYKSFGVLISESLELPINNIFASIRIEFICEGEILKDYVIRQSEYRIFDAQKRLTDKFAISNNYLAVSTTSKVTLSNVSVIDQNRYDDCLIYTLDIDEESVCIVNGQIISVNGEFSNNPVFENLIDTFSVLDEDGNKLVLARDHPILSFLIEEVKLRGTFILINEERYPIDYFDHKTIIDWPKDKTQKAVTLSLDKEAFGDGVYEIILDIPDENRKKIAKYCILKKVNCSTPYNIYTFPDYGSLTVYSDGHQLVVPTDFEMKIIDEGVFRYYFPITEWADHIDVKVTLGESAYILRTPIRVFAYGFSRDALTISKYEYLWYNDMRESLYVKMPAVSNITASLKGDKTRVVHAEPLGDDLYRLDITMFKKRIAEDEKRVYFVLYIDYESDRHRWVELFHILRKPSIEPYFFLQEDDEGIYCDLQIKAPGSVEVSIKDNETGLLLIDHQTMHSGKNYFSGLSKESRYDIYPVYRETDGFFAYSEEALVPRNKVCAINCSDLRGCRMPVMFVLNQGRELYFQDGYSYSMEIQESFSSEVYRGVLREGKRNQDFKKTKWLFFAKIHVELTEYTKEYLRAKVLIYLDDEQRWDPLYYDKQQKLLIRGDADDISEGTDYGRFMLLDEEEASFLIEKKRIWRF